MFLNVLTIARMRVSMHEASVKDLFPKHLDQLFIHLENVTLKAKYFQNIISSF